MKPKQQLETAKESLRVVSDHLKEFVAIIDHFENNKELKNTDLETRSLYVKLKHLSEQYGKIFLEEVDYLQKDIIVEGTLHLNENGKYTMDDYEIDSGIPIEIYLDNDEDEINHAYYKTRLEYAGQYGGGYFAYHFPNLKLEGVRARIRNGNPSKD